MSKYICKRCGYNSPYKSSLKNHLNRKIICEAIFNDIQVEVLLNELEEKRDITICTKCGKKLSNRQNKWKHEKICKVNKNNTNNDTNEIIELKNQINEMSKMLEKMLEKQQNITINNDNSTNTINTNTINNIQNVNIILENLRPLGKENYDFFDLEAFRDCLVPSRLLLYKFVKLIHFNINHPENWNCLITNLKDNKATVYNGNKFVVKDKFETLKKLIKDKREVLEKFLNELEGILDDEKETALYIMNLFDKDGHEYNTNEIINKTVEVAYNSRSKIEIIKNEMDKKNKEDDKIYLGIKN